MLSSVFAVAQIPSPFCKIIFPGSGLVDSPFATPEPDTMYIGVDSDPDLVMCIPKYCVLRDTLATPTDSTMVDTDAVVEYSFCGVVVKDPVTDRNVFNGTKFAMLFFFYFILTF